MEHALLRIQWHDPLQYGPLLSNIALFGFWNASLLKDPEGILHVGDKHSMGHLDRISSLKDLPADKILLSYIKEAALLIKEGKNIPARSKKKPGTAAAATPAPVLPMPAGLTAVLKKNKKAQTAFDAFPPSHRREYIEWIAEAKTEITRDKRIATTLEWLTEGKSRALEVSEEMKVNPPRSPLGSLPRSSAKRQSGSTRYIKAEWRLLLLPFPVRKRLLPRVTGDESVFQRIFHFFW